jgi:hypothetical protein
MVKSGLIVGAGMFVLVLLSAAVVSPLCALCVPVLTGLLAGYLAGVFDKPADSGAAAKRGAGAGAIAGGISIVASLIAAVINAAVMQNPRFQLNRALGLPPSDPATVWIAQFGINCIVGAVNVGLTAGLAALGGMIWAGSARKNQGTPLSPGG